MSTTGKDETSITRKWVGIAADLGVDVKTAKRYAARAERPLPVRRDHFGVYLTHTDRDEWLRNVDGPYLRAS